MLPRLIKMGEPKPGFDREELSARVAELVAENANSESAASMPARLPSRS